MDNIKIGKLICELRKEKNLTQLQLAQMMNISDKTVSKWERGLGSPDISLLKDLSNIFGIDIKDLLSGQISKNPPFVNTFDKINFYICPSCSELLTSNTDKPHIYCCGKQLTPLRVNAPYEDECLLVQKNTTPYELYITTHHPMSKDHYISFAAIQTGDSLIIKKHYPQWELHMHMPYTAKGKYQS